MLHPARQNCLIGTAGCCQRTVTVIINGKPRHHKIIQQRIARPGIKANQSGAICRRYTGQIRHPANIDQNSRPQIVHGINNSRMIDRRQWRPLAALIHVRLPHIMHHINRTGSGQIMGITKLNGLAAKRMLHIGTGVVIDRLTVKTDQIYIAVKICAKRLHSRSMIDGNRPIKAGTGSRIG